MPVENRHYETSGLLEISISSDIFSARVNTAGAYLCLEGLYLFALGIRPHEGRIPVIRMGGHREANEGGWQCAAREVREEANLRIQPLTPPTTFLVDVEHEKDALQSITWQHASDPTPTPLLVAAYRRNEQTILSLMYLAQAQGAPKPASEVKGLLLLSVEEIHAVCRTPLTLGQYLARGGKAMLSGDFDRMMILEPFLQLRLLSRILEETDFNPRWL